MSSLADLFSPTFLIFLGILVLVVALLVVYFENKMREQKHQIASMLSLVSTLAEDINGVKFGLNHLAVNYIGGGQSLEQNIETNNFLNQENLIPVSDDEDDEDEDDDDEDVDEFEDDDSNVSEDENTALLLDENNSDDNNMELIENEDFSDSDSEFGDKSEVKVLKINISNEVNNDINELDLQSGDDLNELTDNLEEIEETDEKEEQQIIETDEIPIENSFDISNLKTINIHLEENKNDANDYKKLSIQKLRSIVAEKGLTEDTSKLKKNDLLKLLGIE
jgi:hypothetical protein